MTGGAGLLVLLGAAGCAQPPAFASCAEDLTGIYVVEGQPAQRWHLIEPRAGALEAYPLFDDAPLSAAPPGIEIAPRALDLAHTAAAPLRGTVKRRYLRGAAACTTSAPATITQCQGQTLEVVLGDPSPPLAYTPCQVGTPGASRRERWTRP